MRRDHEAHLLQPVVCDAESGMCGKVSGQRLILLGENSRLVQGLHMECKGAISMMRSA